MVKSIYNGGEGVSWRTIFAKYERKLVSNDSPTRGPWFVNSMKGVKLRMGMIRKHDFVIFELTLSALQRTWDI